MALRRSAKIILHSQPIRTCLKFEGGACPGVGQCRELDKSSDVEKIIVGDSRHHAELANTVHESKPVTAWYYNKFFETSSYIDFPLENSSDIFCRTFWRASFEIQLKLS